MSSDCTSKNFNRCHQCDENYCMNCSDAFSTGRFCTKDCEDAYYSERKAPIGFSDPRAIDRAQAAGVD